MRIILPSYKLGRFSNSRRAWWVDLVCVPWWKTFPLHYLWQKITECNIFFRGSRYFSNAFFSWGHSKCFSQIYLRILVSPFYFLSFSVLLDSFLLLLSPVFILTPIVCTLNYSYVVTPISKVMNAFLNLPVFSNESKGFGLILLFPTRLPTFLCLFVLNLKFILHLWSPSVLFPHVLPINTNDHYRAFAVSVQNIILDITSLFTYNCLLYLTYIPYITPTFYPALRLIVYIGSTGTT